MDMKTYAELHAPSEDEGRPVSPEEQAIVDMQRDVTELLNLLRPLGPVLNQLPELMGQVGPLLEGLKKSPVLKALGVRLP